MLSAPSIRLRRDAAEMLRVQRADLAVQGSDAILGSGPCFLGLVVLSICESLTQR